MSEDCGICQGTGLGASDAQRCWQCQGRGVLKVQYVYEPEETEREYTAAEYDRMADDYFDR